MMRREQRNIYREHVCGQGVGTLIVLWPYDYMYLSKLRNVHQKVNFSECQFHFLKVPASVLLTATFHSFHVYIIERSGASV